MIISFDISINALILLDKTLLEERLSDLLRAHKLGYNLLIISRNSSKWALQNLNLISADRATLERLALEIAQTGNLVSIASRIIVIGLPGTQISNTDGRITNLPIDSELFHSVIKSPILVIEDIVTDKAIYYFLLEKATKVPLPFVKPQESPAHGGGERIAHVAKEKISESRIVYAIADSDKLHPKAESSKEKALRSLADCMSWPLFFYSVTPGREVENIFGLDVIRRIAVGNTLATLGVLIKIQEWEEINEVPVDDRYCLYFDFKKGVPDGYIEQLTDKMALKWILNKIRVAGIKESNACLPGFGEKIASEVLKDASCKAEIIKKIRSHDWLQVFGRFLEDVRWVFAAAPRHRT